MPSSITRGGVGDGRPLAGLAFPASYRPDDVLIGTWSECAIGHDLMVMAPQQNWGSATYPATNRALGFMFTLTDYFLAQKVWWANGVTATTDAADVGVYTEDGATLLVSGGSTNIAGASLVQEKDCTDTLLTPGRYWCVYNQNGVTATPIMNTATAPQLRAMGCAQFAGAVPLGSTFTPAAVASANIPLCGIAGRTQVA